MKITNRLAFITILATATSLATVADGAISGPCSSCHTMHYSQNGAAIVGHPGGPNATLLIDDCIGCHTGTNAGNAGTGAAVPPYVMQATEPDYGGPGTGGVGTGTETGSTTLAGGNFYWVDAGDDTAGHNVSNLPNNPTDDTLGDTPPGGAIPGGGSLICAGTNGCHGERDVADNASAMKGTHHSSATNRVSDAYRFLEYDSTAGHEIDDYEDPRYEWAAQLATDTHNQYKGLDRTADTLTDYTTISALCASCHGDFHNGAGTLGVIDTGTWETDPWIRHPIDFDMNTVGGNVTGATGTEYAAYGGSGVNDYQVIAPVGSTDAAMGNAATVKSTVLQAAGDAIVTCISCHRAHGTPYADLLRWDYSAACLAGTDDADCGCFKCHTTKDAG